MEVKIVGMDHSGRGIAKVDNKVCFVPNTIIDEKVDIDITLNKKNFMEANLNKILVPSKKRVKEKCKYASICGGCNIMFFSYESQKDYKINKVKDIFRKYCKTDINFDDYISSNDLYYRNKVTFHVSNKIGLYKNKTTDIIEIDKCIIGNKKINEIYFIICNMDLTNINEVVIRSSFNTDDSMVIFNISNDIDYNKLIEPLKEISTSIIVKKNNIYNTIYGKDNILEKLCDLKFVISPDSFFQVNTLQAEKLYMKIKEYLGKCNNLLDLYCGTGTIGLFVSDVCNKVTGIEINRYAINDANKNKELNGIKNIKFICGDSKKVLKKINEKFDAVIVDPPRSGLDKSVIDDLFGINPSKIIYVSCDPITLARDINLLSTNYKLKSISLVDMFPNTSHVECVCLLNKR